MPTSELCLLGLIVIPGVFVLNLRLRGFRADRWREDWPIERLEERTQWLCGQQEEDSCDRRRGDAFSQTLESPDHREAA